MSLAIRPASLSDDEQQLIDVLERNIPGRQRDPFQWRHQNNPVGPGWSWVICERKNDGIVAMVSVFPRRMLVGGKETVSGQVGEFVVDSAYRSLGPALLLQRATFEAVERGALAFCYDCPPHDEGMSTFVRLGMNPNCEVVRYVLPLRSDRYLGKKLGSGSWTKPLVGIANLLLSARIAYRRPSGIEVREFDGVFDEEFSRLDNLVPSADAIRTSRSAEILNWRHRKNPSWKPRILVARRAGELLAFLAFIVFEGRSSIVDIFGRELSHAGVALLEAVVDLSRREGFDCVESYWSTGNAFDAVYRKVGFRQRERAVRVVAYQQQGDQTGKLLNCGLRWDFGQAEVMV